MEEIKLSLCKPPIKVYSNYAYVLSVLLNREEAYDWFYSNFIQVKYIRETQNKHRFIFNYSLGNLTKYFYNVPFLQVRSLNRDFLLKNCGDVIKFLCSALREGYYVVTVVDNYYLSPKHEYKKRHNLHLIMLHGFSEKDSCFYSMGFDNEIYKESKLGFDSFRQAVSSMEGRNSQVRDDYCMMYKLQDENQLAYPQENFNYFPYRFNRGLVKRNFQEYLDSVCSDEHFSAFYEVPSNGEYGISYYDAMIEYVQKFLDGAYTGKIYTIPFHGMMEHKQIMVQRLRYMQEKQYIRNIDSVAEKYEELAAQAMVIRNCVLKYNISIKKELLEKVGRFLEEMYMIEKNTVEQLIMLMN